MIRAYKLLLRPTGQQLGRLTACLEDHRQLYNGALGHRRTAYRMRRATIRYNQQSAELKDIRRDDPNGQGRWSFSSQQATLRRLDAAMTAFFRRVKAGGSTPGYPRFKGRGWFDAVTWPPGARRAAARDWRGRGDRLGRGEPADHLRRRARRQPSVPCRLGSHAACRPA